MADGITIYEEVDCINPYSKSGWFTNPIFEYEPNYFYATLRYSRDVEVFLKNTGDSILDSSDVNYPLELFLLQF